MTVDERIEEIEKEEAGLSEEKTLIMNNFELLAACPFPIVYAGRNTRVVISKTSEITEARHFMEKLFGTRKFEYAYSFFSGSTISAYKASDVDWQIWLECSIEAFPPSLKGKDCQWVETGRKDYRLVCDLEG